MSASPTLATAVAKFGLVASTAAAVGYNVWQMKSVLNQSFDEPNDFRYRYQEELQQQSAQSEAEVTSRVVAHARVKTPIYVIFGSESGTAEMLAMELLEALQTKAASQSWNTTITLVDPNSCDGQDSGVSTDRQVNRCMSMLTEAPSTAIFLFVVATTGDGESPHNFLPMDRALRKLMRKITSAAPTPLSHVKYSVFALGNSTYTHFCNGGVRVREAMKGCGAEELIPMARGDAVDGLQEVVFDAWRDLVLNCFESQATQLFCPYLGIPTTGTSEENESAEPDASTRRIPRGWFHKPVAMEVRAKVQVSQTREEDDSCVFRVTLQTPQLTSTEADFSTTYEAGDHFGVFAPNAPQLIERCLAVCGLSPAQGKQCCVEDGCTVNAWEILERYVDISGPPAYSMMVALAKRGTDDEEKKRLEEYAARHRSGTVAKRTSRDATSEGTLRTTADVLEAFPHCVSGLTVWELIQLLPRMQPRYYSIATDGHYSHPDSVDFFIRTEVGGLISHYVRDVLKEGDQLFAFWRPSKFHYFPAKVKLSPKRPVVMIGPGTGVAPLVGLCYRREALMRLSPSTAWGPLVLFFGARHRTLDYFVQTELERWALPATAMQEWDEKHHYPRESAAARCSRSFSPLSSPVISLLECAFSRDGGPDTASRFYVMDLIKKHGSYICSLLVNQGGLLYVCGDAMRMAPSVEGALIQEMVEHCKFTPLSARSFLRSMEATGLYQKDVYE